VWIHATPKGLTQRTAVAALASRRCALGGLELEDLAAYAIHKNTQTIKKIRAS
jgi:hypothetical protein